MLFLMKCGPLKMETAYLFSNSPTVMKQVRGGKTRGTEKAFVETLRNKQLYQSFTADEAKKGTNRDIRVGTLDLRFVD